MIDVQEVRFPSGGQTCAATLYLPPKSDRPSPGLVMGNGFANVRQMYLRRTESQVRETFLASALADWLDFTRTGRTRMLAITGPDSGESILGAAGYDWHHRNEQRHPTFHNAIAAHSLDRIVGYDPGAFVEDISPTPVLMILAEQDTTTPSEVAQEVFDRLGEPKQMFRFAGGHYDVYEDPAVQQQCIAVTKDFLASHLRSRLLQARPPGRGPLLTPHS